VKTAAFLKANALYFLGLLHDICTEVDLIFWRPVMFANPRLYFEQAPAPRMETLNKRHALSDILSMTLFAVLSEADDWEAIEDFYLGKEHILRQYLPLQNGIPSHDTFHACFHTLTRKPLRRRSSHGR
jgi:hypothetical protein